MKYVRLIGLTALAIALGWLAAQPLLTIFGVRPNIILTLAIPLAFLVRRLGTFVVTLLISIIIVHNVFLFSWESFILFLLSCVFFFIAKRFPWRHYLNVVIGAMAFTLLFYVFITPLFIFNEPIVVFQELLYNGALALIGYIILSGVIAPDTLAYHL